MAAVLLLGGCTVPERRPQLVQLREQAPLAGLPESHAGWPDSQWWLSFQDTQLNQLMTTAAGSSPALDVAEARYRAALIAVDSARADARPQLNGLGSASRAKIDSGSASSAGNADAAAAGAGAAGAQGFSLPSYVSSGVAVADFSYQLDWWGKHRAAIEAALDQAHAARAERSAAAWLIQYAVASTYFDWLAVQQRLQQADAAIRIDQAQLDIAAARVRRGIDSPQTMPPLQQQLASAREQRAQLDGSSHTDLSELAALLGIALAELPPLRAHDLPKFDTTLPDDARVTLLARRPDVVASRWMVEAAARDVDEARTAFFPDISVNALAGFLRSFPTPGSPSSLRFGSVGISAMLPIFDGGRIEARYAQSQAQLDSAIAQYNASVVSAAQDVARQTLTLAALAQQRVQQQLQQQAVDTALAEAQARVRRGIDDPRQALDSEAQVVAQHDAALRLDSQILASNLSLVRALGGGYHSDLPPAAPVGDLPPHQETLP